MAINCEKFGKTKNGEEVLSFTVTNKNGYYIKVLNLGGIIQSVCVPDKDNNLVDVVLGFDSVAEYENDIEYVGALVGRVANRISGSSFELNGKEYTLTPMEFDNSLHGGVVGYSFRIWDHKIEDNSLVLTLHSPDGEEGYPGNLDVQVTYTFSDDCKLRLEYRAISDQDTIVNLTNHAYFNLNGEGDIKEQIMRIDADCFTAINERLVTTGEILSVEGTPFDFRTPKAIGQDLDSDYQQLKYGMGYDHNFILSHGNNCVYAYSKTSGITLNLSTDFPGLQFYTGNCLPERRGKTGIITPQFAGYCLETQYYPDSPHHANFPSIVLEAGKTWKHYAEYAFDCKKEH